MVDDALNNKTILITKKVENCKPYVTSSILFVSISIIVKGIIICFYVKSKIEMFYLIKAILDKNKIFYQKKNIKCAEMIKSPLM